MPLHERKNGKNEVDVYTLGQTIDGYAKEIEIAVIEDVGVMGGHEGTVSMFNFGRNTGVIHGVLGVCSIPMFFVKPAVWKMIMGLSQNKDDSRALASRLYPNDSARWPRKKDDGRAEAALLAAFGAERFLK
jgi:crossover junction endodeoxyribonuclease RuvC